ncbi:MAG: GTPase ObgE [Bdellovibrionales bacterium]|nr:GTPase ObgE [Bdellovibrionales bacterium]
MKFVDEVTISVQAGDGGAGASHFRREKYVPRGGPDGGDGGNGGSIVAVATHSKNTLLDFRYRPHWMAEKGGAGDKGRKSGKNGEDITLQVPVGTEVFRLSEKGEETFVADLAEEGARVVIAKGGRGGKGNTFFKSATNQAPRHSQPGTPGEEGEFKLSLKLLADVGLLGLPNAGKSTFLSRVSAARPEIGDYPFTTKEPQLGIVKSPSGKTCVMADIPGLIEGAHLGKGLGLQFLKHVERTKVLLHLVDVTPLLHEDGKSQLEKDIATIEKELREFSEEVFNKPRLLAFTKIDALPADFPLADTVAPIVSRYASKYCTISSASGQGVADTLGIVFNELEKIS